MKQQEPERLLGELELPNSLRVAIREMLVIQSLYDAMYTHYTQHGEVDENLAGVVQDHMNHLVRVLRVILEGYTADDVPF